MWAALSLAGGGAQVAGAQTVGAPPALAQTVIPPEPLEVVGVAPYALPEQGGGGVSGILAVRARSSAVVKLYDAASGKLRRELRLPPDAQVSVPPAISPDGRWLAVTLTPDLTSREGRISVIPTLEASSAYSVTLKSPGLSGSVALAFGPDSTRLAVGNTSGYAQLWAWRSGERLGTYRHTQGGAPQRLSFSPDGRFFTPFFNNQKAAQVVDASSGRVLATVPGVGSAEYTAGGDFLLAGRSLKLPSGETAPLPVYLLGGVKLLGYDSRRERALVQLPLVTQGDPSVTVELREIATGKPLARQVLDGAWLGSLTLLPDGQHAYALDAGGGLRLLDLYASPRAGLALR